MREVDVNGIERLDGRQQRPGGSADERTHGNLRTSGATRDRRRHGGVVQIEPGFLHLRSALDHFGLRAARACDGRVVLLPAHDSCADEPLVALQVLRGVRCFALRARERCASGVEACLHVARINLEEPLPLLDVATFGVQELLHDTIDSRADLRGPHGLHTAGQHYDIGCVLRINRYDRNLHGGCVRWRCRLTARGQEEHDHKE